MSLVLSHPIVTPTSTVTLRSPVDGNIQRLHTNVSIKRNRAGRVRAVKDTAWPDVEIFVYQFTTITLAVIDQLRAFLQNTAGLEIKLVDHNSVTMNGYIITPEIEMVRERDTCSFDVSFDFRKS